MEPPRKKQKVESQNECSNQNNLIGVDSCLWKNWNSIQKSYSQTKTLNPMTHRERMKEAKVFYDSLTNDTNWPHTLVNKLRSHRVIAHTSKAIPQSHPAKPSRMKKISTFFKPAKSSRNRPPITPQTQQQVMAMRNEPLKHSATKPMMSASPATPAVKPKRKYVKPKQQQMKEQLRVMDEVFIPPPLVFVNNSPSLQLEDNRKLAEKKQFHFAPLFFSLALHIELPPNFHFDWFNELFKGDRDQLNAMICPFCGLQCASKASVLRHRRYAHFRQRADYDKFDNIDLEISRLQKAKIESIDKILNCAAGIAGNEYLCLLKDGTGEWLSLNESNAHVIEYKERISAQEIAIPEIETREDMIQFYGANTIIDISSDDDVDLFHIDKGKKKRNKRRLSRKKKLDLSSGDSESEQSYHDSSSDWDHPDANAHNKNHMDPNAQMKQSSSDGSCSSDDDDPIV